MATKKEVTKVTENVQLNFPFLSSLPFFSSTITAFVCQVVVVCLAWSVGRWDLSVWWVLVAALMWWLAVRAKEKARHVQRTYDALQNNDKKWILDHVEDLPSWVYFPDQERAEWLNRILTRAWPYTNKYLQEMIVSILEPPVNAALPKMLKFKFESIIMGDAAPRIDGIKVYEGHIARGEIVMDARIRYAGDCEIKARVGKFLIGFKDITLMGNMRIILKPLVRQMPFVGGITAFFLSTPAVDFDLTDLADVMDIPGLAELMRKVVHDQVNYFTVLPNKISIPLIPDLSKYDLKFIPPDGVLRIFVAEAQNLMRADVSLIGKGKSDPYCVVNVGAQTFTTQVIKDNINPNWSEYFEAIVDQASGQFLEIEVFDKDQGNKDDFLGRLSIEIFPIVKEGTVDKWFRLEDCETGDIRIRLYWLGLSPDNSNINAVIRETTMLSDRANLSTCLLMVFVEGAQELPTLSKSASEPDPYCVTAVGKETFTTVVIKRSSEPSWEAQHSFLVRDPKNDNMKLEVFDQKSGKRLGWMEYPIRDLLEQKNMDVSGFFPLKNSGPQSAVRLNLRLRVLKATSLEEAVIGAQGVEVNPGFGQEANAGKATLPKERTPPAGAPVSSQEFKERAGQNDGVVYDMPSRHDVRPPVDLDFQSDLRQRNVSEPAIRLTMRWGESHRSLYVVVNEMKNLSKLGNYAGQYYISITMNPFKTKRKTGETGGDADVYSWEETLDFPVDNEQLLKTAYLEVKVKAKSGPFAKDALAQTIVSLESVIGISSHSEWYTLSAAEK